MATKGHQTYQVGPWICPSCGENSGWKYRCTECQHNMAGTNPTTGREERK